MDVIAFRSLWKQAIVVLLYRRGSCRLRLRGPSSARNVPVQPFAKDLMRLFDDMVLSRKVHALPQRPKVLTSKSDIRNTNV